MFGTSLVNLEVNDSVFEDIGDASSEDAFSFETETGGTDNNISGTLTLDNVDLTRFHDTGVHIYNETGTLVANVINGSDFSDNDDNNGRFGVFIETEGNASATLTVDGSEFDNVELDIVRFESGSTGTNDVNILNNLSTAGGGPTGATNGGGIVLVVTNNSTQTFDIQGNTLLDSLGDFVVIVGNTGSGSVEGRIGGPNVSDGNTFSGTTFGDGIKLDNGGVNATGTEDWTILIQNNEIGVDNSGTAGGPFNGIGDDGIQVVFGDHDGTMNLTIEDNTFANILSEGVKTFFDDDLAGGTNPVSQVRIVDNTFTSITSGQGIEHDTRDTAETCLHITGNTLGTADIIIDTRDTSTATISQASAAALSTANGGATVTEQNNGITGFNVACSPTLPGNAMLAGGNVGLVGGSLVDTSGLSARGCPSEPVLVGAGTLRCSADAVS